MQSVHKGVGNCKLFQNKDISLSAEADARLKVEQKLAFAEEFTFLPQSGKSTAQDAEITQSTTDHSEQNVKFADQIAPYEYDIHSAVDPTRRLQDTEDASLQDFFSRPIKLSEINWGTGVQLNEEFDPWSLYFGNKRVVNRIANFKLLRANMHLKFVINGNGFQYGRAIAGYQPLDQYDGMSNYALINADLVGLSQLPHIYIDPTTSTGGDMTLPFYYFKNYVDIPTSGWDDMGKVLIQQINPLKHANGAADKCTISVFGWATDVKMSVLTSRNPDSLVPQSGKEVDEANMKGIISGPATALAKVSNAMTVIPPIAPFAMATANVANAIGAAASSLGYCRPPVTKNPEPFRSFPTSHLAATNVPDTALKLTVDHKQELTIDPRISGLGPEDPMSIKEIAKRETYLTKFTWAVGTSPETLLWNSRITPVIWNESPAGGGTYHFPACAMAALPFKYWTGTMNFRFQVVASTFHKGRIRVVYDPDFLEGNEYNVNYSEVIDIADKSDFTISVGNGQAITLLDNPSPGLSSLIYGTTPLVSKGPGNGTISFKVVNELTIPNDEVNNDVEVNVFVSMGDDFEVFVPDDYFTNFVYKPQSGMENETIIPEAENTEEPSKPMQEKSTTVGPSMQDGSLINKVFTGESIMSFRQMLKRYALWRREAPWPDNGVNTPSNIEWYGSRNMFPFLRGNVTGAVDTTGVAAPYNYCNSLLLHWVTLAHSGWRGSLRYKMIFKNALMDVNEIIEPAASSSNARQQSLYIERSSKGDTLAGYTNTVQTDPGFTSGKEASYQAVSNLVLQANDTKAIVGPRGTLYQDSQINPVAEFEVPYYSDIRFSPGKQVDYSTSNSVYQDGFNWFAQSYADKRSTCDFHVAAGEDFQVYFFTGLPKMHFEFSPPLP